MGRLTADFSAAFSRDLKKKAKQRNWDLAELQKLIDLVLENTPESLETLKRCHNMHRLSGSWAGGGRVPRGELRRLAGDMVGQRRGRLLRAYWRSRRAVQVGGTSLALPAFSGGNAPRATQLWHCQGFLASRPRAPLSSGTANVCWPAAAFFWHCQGFLPSGPHAPLSSGTASIFCHPGPAL